MDTVDWAQSRFTEITGKLTHFLKQAGFRESDVRYVPCSGLNGENLTTKPEIAQLSWYQGPTLVDTIGMYVEGVGVGGTGVVSRALPMLAFLCKNLEYKLPRALL